MTRPSAPKKGDDTRALVMMATAAVAMAVAIGYGKATGMGRADYAHAAAQSQPRPRDVLVAAYPKSGHYWLRFLLAHAWALREDNFPPPPEVDFASIEAFMPDLEYGPARQAFAAHAAPSPGDVRPRLYKSHQAHVPWPGASPPCDASVGPGLDPQACACPNCPARWRRVVYLVRDGRDAVCSHWHFERALGNLAAPNATFAEFVSAKGTYPGVGWGAHVASYAGAVVDPSAAATAAASPDARVEGYLVRYEALHADAAGAVADLARWLGWKLEPHAAKEAAAKASFDAMSKSEDATPPVLFEKHYGGARGAGFRLTRSGKAGGWRQCFGDRGSPEGDEARRVFMAEHGASMVAYGYLGSLDEEW